MSTQFSPQALDEMLKKMGMSIDSGAPKIDSSISQVNQFQPNYYQPTGIGFPYLMHGLFMDSAFGINYMGEQTSLGAQSSVLPMPMEPSFFQPGFVGGHNVLGLGNNSVLPYDQSLLGQSNQTDIDHSNMLSHSDQSPEQTATFTIVDNLNLLGDVNIEPEETSPPTIVPKQQDTPPSTKPFSWADITKTTSPTSLNSASDVGGSTTNTPNSSTTSAQSSVSSTNNTGNVKKNNGNNNGKSGNFTPVKTTVSTSNGKNNSGQGVKEISNGISNTNQNPPSATDNNKQKEYSASVVGIDNFANINSPTFDCNPSYAKFFVIKSYNEDDVHKSIKYSIWTSTDTGNKRLDRAFRDCAGRGPVYLFFSVNSSGQFCGLAEMTSPLDYSKKASCWNDDKWSGQFSVSWKIIKDIQNSHLRHIKLVNNENKPVTNSRDTQEILYQPGIELLSLFHKFQFKSSLLDDFEYYNECEVKDQSTKLQDNTTNNNASNSNQTNANQKGTAKTRGKGNNNTGVELSV